MSLQIMAILLYCLQFVCCLFLFSAYLLWLWLSVWCWIRVLGMRDLRAEAFSFSPFSVMLAVDLSYMAFIVWRYIPFKPSLLRLFIMKSFFCICWFLSFILFNIMNHIHWLEYVVPYLFFFFFFSYLLLSLSIHVWLFVAPWTVARQAPLSMEFFKGEYWCGLPFPSQQDLPGTGIEPVFLMSPALAGRLLTTSATWYQNKSHWSWPIIL